MTCYCTFQLHTVLEEPSCWGICNQLGIQCIPLQSLDYMFLLHRSVAGKRCWDKMILLDTQCKPVKKKVVFNS